VKCDECGQPLDPEGNVDITDLGVFHLHCTQRCPHGQTWPASMFTFGDVVFACNGCARAAA
jgi:hypothetical protein